MFCILCSDTLVISKKYRYEYFREMFYICKYFKKKASDLVYLAVRQKYRNGALLNWN